MALLKSYSLDTFLPEIFLCGTDIKQSMIISSVGSAFVGALLGAVGSYIAQEEVRKNKQEGKIEQLRHSLIAELGEGVIEQFVWLSTDSALAVPKQLYTAPQGAQSLSLILLPEDK